MMDEATLADAPGGMDEAATRRACGYTAVDLERERDEARDEVRRLSAALAEQQRENERQADLIDEFRKRNESQDRIRKRLISERDALQVDNSVQFDRAEAAESALADLRALAEWLVSMDDPDDSAGLYARRSVTLTAIINRARAALAAAPSGEQR